MTNAHFDFLQLVAASDQLASARDALRAAIAYHAGSVTPNREEQVRMDELLCTIDGAVESVGDLLKVGL